MASPPLPATASSEPYTTAAHYELLYTAVVHPAIAAPNQEVSRTRAAAVILVVREISEAEPFRTFNEIQHALPGLQ